MTTAITAITVQNTLGVTNVEVLKPSFVQEQISSVLEDFKVNDIPLKSVDLIQENTIDRFERKNKNAGNNQNRKRPNNNNNNQRSPQRAENKGVAKNTERVAKPNESKQPQASTNQNQQPKKFKKKFHPKRDDKA